MIIDMCVYFFFFKQKTAYEMRISDWSSDVCSSDLRHVVAGRLSRLSGRAGLLRLQGGRPGVGRGAARHARAGGHRGLGDLSRLREEPHDREERLPDALSDDGRTRRRHHPARPRRQPGPHRLPAPALRAGLAARPAAAGLDGSADDPPAGEILSRRMSGGVVASTARGTKTNYSLEL